MHNFTADGGTVSDPDQGQLQHSNYTVILQNAEEAEWESFQKEIAVEVAASAQMTAEEQLEETTDRQLEVTGFIFYITIF